MAGICCSRIQPWILLSRKLRIMIIKSKWLSLIRITTRRNPLHKPTLIQIPRLLLLHKEISSCRLQSWPPIVSRRRRIQMEVYIVGLRPVLLRNDLTGVVIKISWCRLLMLLLRLRILMLSWVEMVEGDLVLRVLVATGTRAMSLIDQDVLLAWIQVTVVMRVIHMLLLLLMLSRQIVMTGEEQWTCRVQETVFNTDTAAVCWYIWADLLALWMV